MDTLEVADVFRQFGPSYLERFGARMLPSHRRAIEDITACRTRAMGGHVYECCDCGEHFHVYHGCRNRSCPACHTRQTQDWLEARAAELLPCPYYHVTMTVPSELRDMFRANQKDCYGLLMKAAAETVMALCQDKRYMGAKPAILAVLHTWNGTMGYHPHVHLLVSGGGIADGGATWREAKHRFLFPVRAASPMLCGKFRALLEKRQPGLADQQPGAAWTKKWVVWCKYWGRGETAVLDYLARYVHRIAITNARIVAMDERSVTFRYKERKKSRWRTCTLTGHEFMRRFLQHVLPKGLHKIRYYALWNPKLGAQQQNARIALELAQAPAEEIGGAQDLKDTDDNQEPSTGIGSDTPNTAPACPHCGSVNTRHKRDLRPDRRRHSARASPRTAA